MNDKRILLDHLNKIHTTESGVTRIKKNLNLNSAGMVAFCKKKISATDCFVYKQGKNYYCLIDNIRFTINANSYTIITAHKTSMDKAVIYIHGQGGNAEEANHYKHLFKDGDVIGFDYKAQTPWEAKEEFPLFFDLMCSKFESVILIANSIGAYFSMHALAGRKIAKAFLISPVADMEKLILNMMEQAGVTEEELREKREIPTDSGAVLSWKYLSYVKAHPVEWSIPTEILYGEKDVITSFEIISGFAHRIGAGLTVMKGGEHWFHTEEQMAFADMWLRKCLTKK
jgi:hypothetical protein